MKATMAITLKEAQETTAIVLYLFSLSLFLKAKKEEKRHRNPRRISEREEAKGGDDDQENQPVL